MIVYTFLIDADIQILNWCDYYSLAGEPLKKISLRAKRMEMLSFTYESLMVSLFWTDQYSFRRYFNHRFGCADVHSLKN
jgi:hypothetical protein